MLPFYEEKHKYLIITRKEENKAITYRGAIEGFISIEIYKNLMLPFHEGKHKHLITTRKDENEVWGGSLNQDIFLR